MRGHLLKAFILWIVLTAVTEAFALGADFFPLAAAKEAHFVDSAFRTLMVLGAPVFAFVVAALAYSVMRFRANGDLFDGRGVAPDVVLEPKPEDHLKDGGDSVLDAALARLKKQP